MKLLWEMYVFIAVECADEEIIYVRCCTVLKVMLHSSLRAQERAQWDRENEARLEAEKRER